MEIFERTSQKYYPILAFKKAFWVMDLGMKFATFADIRKGEKFISARVGSNGCKRYFFLPLTLGKLSH